MSANQNEHVLHVLHVPCAHDRPTDRPPGPDPHSGPAPSISPDKSSGGMPHAAAPEAAAAAAEKKPPVNGGGSRQVAAGVPLLSSEKAAAAAEQQQPEPGYRIDQLKKDFRARCVGVWLRSGVC